MKRKGVKERRWERGNTRGGEKRKEGERREEERKEGKTEIGEGLRDSLLLNDILS